MKQALINLSAYDPQPTKASIYLHANEVNQSLPLLLKPSALDALNRYPDHQATLFKHQLVTTYGYDVNSILVGSGSSELLELMVKTCVNPGDVVLSLDPTFVMYEQYTLLHGGRYVSIPFSSSSLQDLQQAATLHQPSLIFLSNPNNPTGHYFSSTELFSFLSNVMCPVVVDEAYIEYVDEQKSLAYHIKDFNNLYVTRTFSKAFALAGARLGYMITQPSNMQALKKAKTPYSVSSLSLTLGMEALKQKSTMDSIIQTMIQTREQTYKAMRELGIKVSPSSGNFLYVEETRYDLYGHLLRKGILIRSYNNGFYRISIGTHADMQTLMIALKEIIL